VRGCIPSAWPAATLAGLHAQVRTQCRSGAIQSVPLIDDANMYTCFCQGIRCHQPSGPSTDDKYVDIAFLRKRDSHGGKLKVQRQEIAQASQGMEKGFK
jgi:hypothetical protein